MLRGPKVLINIVLGLELGPSWGEQAQDRQAVITLGEAGGSSSGKGGSKCYLGP